MLLQANQNMLKITFQVYYVQKNSLTIANLQTFLFKPKTFRRKFPGLAQLKKI